MARWYKVGIGALALACGGCALLPIAGASVGSGLIGAGAYAAIAGGVGTADEVIRVACDTYDANKLAAEALVAGGTLRASTVNKVRVIEEYGDAACRAPPSDILGTAVWLGQLAGQIATIVKEERT